MPIPSLEQFDSVLSIAEEMFFLEARQCINSLVDDDGLIPVQNHEALRSVLLDHDRLRIRQWDRVRREPAYRWLIGQSGYRRAEQIVWIGRKRKAILNNPSLHQPIPDLLFAKILKNPRLFYRLYSDSLSSTWDIGYLRALREYYHTGNADLIQSAANRLGDIEREMQSISDSLGALSSVVLGNSKGGLVERNSVRLMNYLDLLQRSPITRLYVRSSQYAKERLLAKRLFDVNRRSARSSSAEAIAEMLTVDGIKNQVDLRTLYRWCKVFAESAS